MTTTPIPSHLWFLNTAVTIRISEEDGNDGVSILDHSAPYRDSPPMHVHRTEDEIFQILQGEFRLNIDGKEQRAIAGDILILPKGIPHSYRVESREGGRFLTITARGDFEEFVRATGRPATRPGLPEPAAPSPEAIEVLSAIAAQYGIEIVGPPLE